MTLEERFEKIRSNPKLQSQQQSHTVLTAIDSTLQEHNTSPTPIAYFSALLGLLTQSNQNSIQSTPHAPAILYLLELTTPHVTTALLRSKFDTILSALALPLTNQSDSSAPLLRSAIGVLESLLLVQDAAGWAQPITQLSPRRAVAGLLTLSADARPKVRKRATEAVARVLAQPPTSPRLDHPAAEMCAETALTQVRELGGHQTSRGHGKNGVGAKEHMQQQKQASLIHSLQLIKAIAGIGGRGWPATKLDDLCEVLLGITRESGSFLTMTAFEVFEVLFEGVSADEGVAAAKLPRLLEIVQELQPERKDDAQLLPPWIAVLVRGYEVAAQVEPDETFLKLPDTAKIVAGYLSSSSENVRVSASEGLIALISTCVPDTVLLDPSVYDEKTLERLAAVIGDLFSVANKAGWQEVFKVMGATFDALRWRSTSLLSGIVKTVGELRGDESFAGKKQADAVLARAVRAMGPDEVLALLPLNLLKPTAGQPGRAWLLPILRDAVGNTRLAHFRTELVPLSEAMFQRVLDHGNEAKTMDIKVFETVVQQIWAVLPGYCDLPLDLIEAFDQSFAEMMSNLLYQQPDLRKDLCHSLQSLVESNQAVENADEDDLIAHGRTSRADARRNIEHLATFAGNVLAVLFNVYNETLPQYRGTILQCINAYLSVTPEKELTETFTRVSSMLESSLAEAAPAESQAEKHKQKSNNPSKMPPMTHTLMDLIVTISIHLPRASFHSLFSLAATVVATPGRDPQLQKKAYRLIPRLATSETGLAALRDRSSELQSLLIASADHVSAPARRDRLAALSIVVEHLPPKDLYFIPATMSEAVMGTKETNEKARMAAFDLILTMATRMAAGGEIDHARVPHLSSSNVDKHDVTVAQASLSEFTTMLSAGLAGSHPHPVSASILALTRVLYTHHAALPAATLADIASTLELFLTTSSREIARAAIGFAKLEVVSFPDAAFRPSGAEDDGALTRRLGVLVERLLPWSREAKARLKSKVKGVLERMIRRWGADAIEAATPATDRKVVANIRKTRDRKKRHKDAATVEGADADADEGVGTIARPGADAFEDAIYGSDDDESGDETAAGRGTATAKMADNADHIDAEPEEPLDLLDRRALGRIAAAASSASRQPRRKAQRGVKVDLDGKLVLGDDDDMPDGAHDDEDMRDADAEQPARGVDAYVAAIRGRDAPMRGRGGRMKFKSKGRKDDDDEMDVDERELAKVVKERNGRGGRGGRGMPVGRGGRGGGMRGGRGGRGGPARGRVIKSRGRGFGMQKRAGVTSRG